MTNASWFTIIIFKFTNGIGLSAWLVNVIKPICRKRTSVNPPPARLAPFGPFRLADGGEFGCHVSPSIGLRPAHDAEIHAKHAVGVSQFPLPEFLAVPAVDGAGLWIDLIEHPPFGRPHDDRFAIRRGGRNERTDRMKPSDRKSLLQMIAASASA